MTRGRGTASIVASPVLVGAVTTLIVIVSVFLAYNANTGLPFVPTYNLRAQIPGGENLVPGNEVRLGGFRVGLVDRIGTGTEIVAGQPRAVAVVRLKLDKTVQPLPADTTLVVRPRSALGLKYIQLTPGKSKQTFRPGATIPLTNSKAPVEFDDFLNTFDDATRQNSQDALTGFGNALSGRGSDINNAIAGLAPFFRYLQPVMRNLSDPKTGLNEFFKQIGRANAQIAPVARINAETFGEMADTFRAIGNDPAALRATIEKNPPTEDVSIHSFRVQRPFLADFADLSRRLLPAAEELPRALPLLNAAFRVGTPVSRQSVVLNKNTEEVFNALDDLAKDPNTLLALKDIGALVKVGKPLVTYVAPFQTVCNYATYFLDGLGSHLSESSANGTSERVLAKLQSNQEDRITDYPDARQYDVPSNVDPTGANTGGQNPDPLMAYHAQPYAPAIDAQGNADCVAGQFGNLDGPLFDRPGRYPPAPGERDTTQNPADTPENDVGTFNSWQKAHAGGSHVVTAQDPPFLYGPTFTGVKNLKDVP